MQPAGDLYSGKEYCFALARFGSEEDGRTLEAYLDICLRQPDRSSDCGRVRGVLPMIDVKGGCLSVLTARKRRIRGAIVGRESDRCPKIYGSDEGTYLVAFRPIRAER
ncbi:DUF6000 family protein [Streptomyces sp. NPDC096142]|uniref:DUF6000 family protein n=1 Tax=Streptomyces sp. NPDC096142 TaxID=3366077 RepID=UPI0038125E08